MARLRTINLAPEVDFDVAQEVRSNRTNRDQSRRAKLDLAIDSAAERDREAARAAAAAKAVKDAQREGVMKGYIRDREQIPQIPVGVVNPQYLKQGVGPQQANESQIDLAPVERRARIDLANIDPTASEVFRTGMDTEREAVAQRGRLAAAEIRSGEKHATDLRKTDADIANDAGALEETRRKNSVQEQLERLKILNKPAPAFKPTPGQAAIDRAFAKDIVDWSMGGASAVEKDLKQLEAVLEEIAPVDKNTGKRKGRSNISGPFIGLIPDRMKPAVGLGKSLDVQERVQEVAQKNLREILGGQFAMKEGEQLIARAYNPRLAPEENAKRIERLLPQMKAAAAAKEEAAQYFRENGTLAGYDLTRLQQGVDGLKGAIEGLDKQPQGSGDDGYERYLELKQKAGQ